MPGRQNADRTAAKFAGLSGVLLAATIGLMTSELPVFWPLFGTTLGLAASLTLTLLNWDPVQARGRTVRFLVAGVAALTTVGMMVKPLRAQYRQDNPALEPGPPRLTVTPSGIPVGAAPFELTGYPWDPVMGTAAGTVEVDGAFLKVKITKLAVRTQATLTNATLAYIRPGIAVWRRDVPPHEHSTGSPWHVAAWGEKYEVRQRLEPWATLSLAAFDRLIPIDGVEDMQHGWLTLELGVESGADFTRRPTYAHSNHSLFHHHRGHWRFWPWSPR